MESSIALKIKNFTIDPKYAASYEKFIGCLSDSFVSLEEFNQILGLLNSKGIVITKPSQFSVFTNGYEYISSVITEYENLNCLQLLIDNPLRLNNKEAINRLSYLISNNIPYLNEKGKCIKEVYSKELFDAKYTNVVNDEPVSFAFEESHLDEPVAVEIPVDPIDLITETQAPIVADSPVLETAVEPTDLIIDASVPVVEESPIELSSINEPAAIEPVVEPTDLIIDASVPVVEESPTELSTINEPVAVEPVVEPTVNSDIAISMDNSTNVEFEETPVINEEVDPIKEILSKPQTIALDDETFDRYDSLAESVRQVLCRVYNVTELNDNIIDNLIKLVTNGIEDDKFVMYTAITYGKNVSEEEKMCLTKAIEEELDYTSIMNIGLGRVA